MLGGYNPTEKKSHLYFIDYLGAQVEVPYGAHGYGGMMAITVMDRYYKPGNSNNFKTHFIFEIILCIFKNQISLIMTYVVPI